MNAPLRVVFGSVGGAKAGPGSLEDLRRAWEAIRGSEEFRGARSGLGVPSARPSSPPLF